MGELDSAFIVAPEHRPKLCFTEPEGIPVIDLSSLSDPCTLEGIVKEIGKACKEWGFFQVINHGSGLQSRKRIDAVSRKFFGLSLEEKKKVKRDAMQVMGYHDSEHTKNVRDWKEVYEFVVEEPTLMPASLHPHDKEVTQWFNKWPQNPPEFREVCKQYAQDMEKLAFKLLELIALSLGLPPKRFHKFFEHQCSYVKLNYYPPCPSPDLVLGCGRHKDFDVLTILAQDDVGGLEVRRKKDGEWVQVKPIPDAYIINIGDVIQIWSNDAYESVEHRVIANSNKERLSTPFFLHVAHYTMVEPMEELTNKDNPPKYRPSNWGKFLATRKYSNFTKLEVENIQIYDLKK
ncbi:hypothetical protein VNO77_42188 [Canavalia gladiata]|uniref:Fe2OG dioxygenase domain-containing protein n=1 Tax=Canavalia gladiata TaxID=3824 RepID=A0AAN9PQS6_CANGL